MAELTELPEKAKAPRVPLNLDKMKEGQSSIDDVQTVTTARAVNEVAITVRGDAKMKATRILQLLPAVLGKGQAMAAWRPKNAGQVVVACLSEGSCLLSLYSRAAMPKPDCCHNLGPGRPLWLDWDCDGQSVAMMQVRGAPSGRRRRRPPPSCRVLPRTAAHAAAAGSRHRRRRHRRRRPPHPAAAPSSRGTRSSASSSPAPSARRALCPTQSSRDALPARRLPTRSLAARVPSRRPLARSRCPAPPHPLARSLSRVARAGGRGHLPMGAQGRRRPRLPAVATRADDHDRHVLLRLVEKVNQRPRARDREHARGSARARTCGPAASSSATSHARGPPRSPAARAGISSSRSGRTRAR